ncbi:hypothetical protein HPB48_020014 [Haemaphysalis longicornis]|uniref:Uncharacterized protein n=1 Tax=Haemaphysalis longicornis TaxID=44386 RepID=A0A9J6H2F9_HAELO|nr:hypothetical protein HPB48_020014 [Haemaphysalis longicornis]
MADMEPSETAREDTNHEDNQCTDEMETNASPLSEGERDDTEDDDGGDWFTVARKRRQPARQSAMATTMTAGSARSSHQEQARKPRLPPLPTSDYKVVLRPREGLNFGKWQTNHVARAVGQSARIIATEFQALTLRIRDDQNIAMASTPNEELADSIRPIKSIQLGDKMYQVTAYVAAPDESCKSVVTGIDSGTHSDELMANLRSPRVPILYARMLGKSKAALITFDGLEVQRAIYYYGGELRRRPYRPLCQICSLCLKTGHRADVCPTPEKTRCARCGHETHRRPTTANQNVCCVETHTRPWNPTCPARQRKPYNKSRLLQNARNITNL